MRLINLYTHMHIFIYTYYHILIYCINIRKYVYIYPVPSFVCFFFARFFPNVYRKSTRFRTHQKKVHDFFLDHAWAKNTWPSQQMSAVHWACQSMFSTEPRLLAPKAAVLAETMCCRSQGNSQGLATMRNTTYLTHNCKCRTTWLHMIMFQGQVLAQDMQYTCAIACIEAARRMESSSCHVEKPDLKMSIHFSECSKPHACKWWLRADRWWKAWAHARP